MKKHFLFPILQLVCSSVFSFSDLECRVDELERQIQQLRIITPNETCGADTALARPILDVECGCCGSNYFVEASILYWHAIVSGTEFTSGSFVVKPSPFQGSLKDCFQTIELNGNWGFKLGLGYNLPCDGWDIFLNYVSFNSKGNKAVCRGTDTKYIVNYKSFPLIQGTSVVSKRAKSTFCLDLDALEFNLGRSFYISKSMALCPKIGLKAFWIEFKQNTRYGLAQTWENIWQETDHPSFNYTIKDRCKFSGVGPHFVFGTEWHFFNDFCLYGNISGSLLYGLFTTHHKDKETTIEGELRNCLCQSRHAFVPMVNTQIGIAYGIYCNCDLMHLILRLAFDAQYICRINQIIALNDVTLIYRRISEDMSIHGITFDIRLDF